MEETSRMESQLHRESEWNWNSKVGSRRARENGQKGSQCVREEMENFNCICQSSGQLLFRPCLLVRSGHLLTLYYYFLLTSGECVAASGSLAKESARSQFKPGKRSFLLSPFPASWSVGSKSTHEGRTGEKVVIGNWLTTTGTFFSLQKEKRSCFWISQTQLTLSHTGKLQPCVCLRMNRAKAKREKAEPKKHRTQWASKILCKLVLSEHTHTHSQATCCIQYPKSNKAHGETLGERERGLLLQIMLFKNQQSSNGITQVPAGTATQRQQQQQQQQHQVKGGNNKCKVKGQHHLETVSQ